MHTHVTNIEYKRNSFNRFRPFALTSKPFLRGTDNRIRVGDGCVFVRGTDVYSCGGQVCIRAGDG